MDQTNRISKDTMARKGAKQTAMHSAMEMAAVKASHQAYLDSIIQDYEAKMEGIEKEHEAEVQELVGFSMKGSGLKTQTYLRRPTNSFIEATREYWEKRNGVVVKYRHKDCLFRSDSSHTLQQLNIRNGDELWPAEKSVPGATTPQALPVPSLPIKQEKSVKKESDSVIVNLDG